MPTHGFHSEWATIKDHRVHLECRASFPDEKMRLIARVAVETCDNNSEGLARVVKVFYDDKACTWAINVVTTDPKDNKLENQLMTVLHTMFGDGNCHTEVEIVASGNTSSDHYCHTEHLSIKSGVAVDRFRHNDEKYMESIESSG